MDGRDLELLEVGGLGSLKCQNSLQLRHCTTVGLVVASTTQQMNTPTPQPGCPAGNVNGLRPHG